MKRQGYSLNKLMLGVFVLAALCTSHAQYDGPIVNVSIPFNFNIGAQRFVAGDYSFKPLLPHTITLQTRRGHGLTNASSISVISRDAPNATTVVFNRYLDRYFLSEIWVQGNNDGQAFIKSPVEKELAKELAVPPIQVALNVGFNH